jgi:ribosomal protein S18 acetylase RimI-like enzyme
MYEIRPAHDTDFDQVVALLHRLQAVPEHTIGYHGETSEELTAELTDLQWPSTTVVAVDGADRVHGVLSFDVDHTLGRVWWHGPFVDVPAEHPAADRIWDRTADALYDAARALPGLRDISDSELFGHVEHTRLAGFARRHGFPSGRYTSVLALDGVDLVRLIGTVSNRPDAVDVREFPTPPTDSVAAAALIRLHEACFPNTYISAAQLLAGGPDRTVIAAFDGGCLVGYAVGRVQQAEYFVDFVAVATESRGRGIAGALVTALIQRLADRHGARSKACATVVGGNAASRRMLHNLGFLPLLELVSYRLRAQRLVA